MSEHLPECPRALHDCERCDRGCYCNELRACEERVLSGDERWIKASTEANHRIAYRLGHDAGLDAAREAVKGVNWFNDEGKMLSAVVATADSIAAIDALKGEAMTEHLPECPVIALLIKGNTVAAGSCICARLRACEERVLNAARDAVTAIESDRDALVWWERFGDNPDDPDEVTVLIDLKRAIAAIDAIRGES